MMDRRRMDSWITTRVAKFSERAPGGAAYAGETRSSVTAETARDADVA